jgi:hypothetical protein
MQRAVPEAGGNPARPRHCNGNETPSNATGRAMRAGKAGGVGGPKSGDDPAPSARDVPRGRDGRRVLCLRGPGSFRLVLPGLFRAEGTG